MKPIESLVDRVFRGDCTQLLKEVPSGSVDLVITDPPHLSHEPGSDRAWLGPAFAEIARVLKPDRFCVSFYSWSRADRFLAVWRSVGLWPVGHLVWVRPYAALTRFVRGKHESAYLLAKGRPEMPKNPIPDVLPWAAGESPLGSAPPTRMPSKALEPLVRSFSREGDIVLDPFMGSGSTLVVAQRMGRRGIGMELDQECYGVALKRLRRLTA